MTAVSLYTPLRDEIIKKIKTVSGAGKNVWNRQRYAVDQNMYIKDFYDYISGTKTLIGWMVTWVGIPETDQEWGHMGATGDLYRFNVIGVQAFQDAPTKSDTIGSETSFFPVVENVVQVIRDIQDYALPNNCVAFGTKVSMSTPLQLRTFGPSLCHYAELTVDVLVQQSQSFGN